MKPPSTVSETLPLAVVGAAILRGDRCFAAQRNAAGREALKWEFPGGKVEVGESPREALAREIREELGVDVRIGTWLGRGIVNGGDRHLELDVYTAVVRRGEITLREHRRAGWFRHDELDELDWAAADIPVLPRLRALLRERAGGKDVL